MDIKSRTARLMADKYVGNHYQLAGTRRYTLQDGYANGTSCVDVKTGTGLEYTVVLDRGLDLSLASYNGVNLTYLTENAESNPKFFNTYDSEWLRTFTAGLLTTCGPNNISDSCVDEGERLGLHGRWSTIPAKNVSVQNDFERGHIEISGTLYESVLFGPKLKITRTISSKIGSSEINIEDEIKNEGGVDAPLNVLYHINFGYPLVSEAVRVFVSSTNCEGCDEYSCERMNEVKGIKMPDGNNFEKNYNHVFDDTDENAIAYVRNDDLIDGVLFYIKFNTKQLPYLNQWTCESVKDYVLSLEPANVPCKPRSELREDGIFPYIKAGETVKHSLTLGVINGKDNIEFFIKNI